MSEFAWIAELEKAVRKPGCDDEEMEGREEGYPEEEADENEEQEQRPVRKAATSKGRYAPAPNGENDEDGEEPKVHGKDSINQKSGGGSVAFGGKNKISKGLDAEQLEAIDVSEVLSSLVKSLDRALDQRDAALREVAGMKNEFEQIHKSLAALGGAMCKSLGAQENLSKSIAADVERIGATPAPRKSTLRSVEKSFAGNNGSAGAVPSPTVRLEKSMAALQTGRISTLESAILEQSANVGEFRHDLWQKVTG